MAPSSVAAASTARRGRPDAGGAPSTRVARRRRSLAIVAVLVVAVAGLAVPRLATWQGNRAAVREKAAALAVLQTRNDELKASLARASTPTALEEQSRRLNLVRRGEQPWSVDGLDPAPAP